MIYLNGIFGTDASNNWLADGVRFEFVMWIGKDRHGARTLAEDCAETDSNRLVRGGGGVMTAKVIS